MLGWLGLIFGTLSMVMLFKETLDHAFVAPMQSVLDRYEALLQAVFASAEPWINRQLHVVALPPDLAVPLYPHAKHVFVLMVLYFFRATSVVFWTFKGHGTGWSDLRGNIVPATVAGFAGLIIAAIFSAWMGVLSLSAHDFAGQMAVVTIPILGLAVYDLTGSGFNALWRGRHPWQHRVIKLFAWHGLMRMVGALLIAAVFIPFVQKDVPNAGLAVLFGLIGLLGAYWSLVGSWRWGQVLFPRLFRAPIDLRPEYPGIAPTNAKPVGSAILGTMLFATLLLACNVSLKVAGL